MLINKKLYDVDVMGGGGDTSMPEPLFQTKFSQAFHENIAAKKLSDAELEKLREEIAALESPAITDETHAQIAAKKLNPEELNALHTDVEKTISTINAGKTVEYDGTTTGKIESLFK